MVRAENAQIICKRATSALRRDVVLFAQTMNTVPAASSILISPNYKGRHKVSVRF